MSDVEKAISGLVQDEELLQNEEEQQLHQQQQSTATAAFSKINLNSYNLQNETGNSSLLQQKQSCHNKSLHQRKHIKHHDHHQHQQQHQLITFQPDSSTNTSYLTAKQQHNCLSRVAKLIFSTPGLVVMVVVYSIMGAFIFPLLEAPQDISKSALIAKSREECLKELWIITEKLNVLYERNWTMLVHEQLRRFEGTIVAATRNMAAGATVSSGAANAAMPVGSADRPSGAGAVGTSGGYGMATEKAITTATVGRFGGSNLMEYSDLTTTTITAPTRWSFSEALLYSVTVITTIGHGSLTPRTAGGKIATIFYALIGVPLMLMCLSSLGALLAEALQCTYARICCRWQEYVAEGSDSLQQDLAHSKHLQTAKHLKCPVNDDARKTEISVEKGTTHQIKLCLPHQNDINCKNCKYDAIIGEMNTNHGYDYTLCNDATTTTTAAAAAASSSLSSSSVAATATATTTAAVLTTLKLGHKEDCCQLLQNSSGKLTQHLSSCMQLKVSPTVSGSAMDTKVNQQQQQQHYYQQRPDVMLMATGHKLSVQQQQQQQQPSTMTPAASCRLILPPFLPASQTARFYANATPAIATYHLVSSASANSSPTHHQSIRHYIVPQMPATPAATSKTSVMGAQHFMAVPSTLVRFHHQTSPQTSMQHSQQQQHGNVTTSSSSSNMNPLALPASGSATVYFPILTPSAAAAGDGGGGGPQNSTQPLVKYHTIQMPNKRQHGLTLFQQSCNSNSNNNNQNNILHDNQHMAGVEDNTEDPAIFPPPPPPAYQTATVHGIRRAKFVTKPLPQDINNLLHESDISCRHDLSQNLTTFNSSNNASSVGEQQFQLATNTVYTPATTATHTVMLSNGNGTKTEITMAAAAATTAATTATTTMATAVGNFYGSNNTTTNTGSSSSSPASGVPPPTTNTTQANSNTTNNAINIYENQEIAINQQTAQAANNQTNLILVSGSGTSELAATATVDIMEDEEEQEQQRLGNCPHGTPSRVPLLTGSSNSPDDKSHTRGFLNATAASFHRHTLNTFQRSNQRKSVIINRKGECNLHIPKRRYAPSATTSCYDDQYPETSDDDCGGLEATNSYKLKQLHSSRCLNSRTDKQLGRADFCDNHSLVSLSETTSQIPQVPMIVVLFILIFYVCLGTVIFALWENWSLIDGAYFCFVTLTTIGYGDFMPWKTFQGPEIQLFACCAYLLLGLVLVAMSFSILETQLIWKCKRLAVRLKLSKE